MLRIATWYESRLGRNDGNPLYVTACLKRMQYYSAIHGGLGKDQDLYNRWWPKDVPDLLADASAKSLIEKHGEILEADHLYPTGETQAFGTYDLNVWVDWGEDGLTTILPYTPIDCPKPMAYWASDTHIHDPGYQYRLKMARKAKFVFVAQKRALEDFVKDGVENPIWLPHAVEPLAWPKTDVATKHFDVCFVGHVSSQNRAEALDHLFREFPNFYYGQALFEDAAAKFCDSKIVFNISMTDDINMRTFEAMATGSFLLTNWIPTIEELFEDGKHLVLYRTPEEMIEKAKYYLAHDDEREKIAQAGYEEVMKKHTIQHRVDRILAEYLKTREVAHAGI